MLESLRLLFPNIQFQLAVFQCTNQDYFYKSRSRSVNCPDRGRRGPGLDEDVGEGIALFELEADFSGEVVVGVLGFPDAVDEGEIVDEGSVGAEGLLVGAFEGVLGDNVPAVGAGAAAEKFFEGEASVALGGVAVFVGDG